MKQELNSATYIFSANRGCIMKRILFFCLIFLVTVLSVNVTASASTTNVSRYKSALKKGFDKYDKEDIYYYKVKQNGNNLYVKISLPDRQEIYGGDFYNFYAYQAVKRTSFDPTVSTVTVKSYDDKYTFNISDVKALPFTHTDIKQNAKQYNDGEDNEYSYYLTDKLYPKAIFHKSYHQDDD